MKTNTLTGILFRTLTCALSKRMRSFCATFILFFTVGINSAWGDTWTVAGVVEIVNGNVAWDKAATANDMTNVEGHWWGLLVENLYLEKREGDNRFEFKVFKNHADQEAYPSSNYWLHNSTAGHSKVIYSFTDDNHDVLAVPFNDWRVIGHSTVFGSSWDVNDVNNNMVRRGDWEYTLTKRNIPLGASTDYGFKIINDDNTYYCPSSDWNIRVDNAGVYDVEIVFNVVTKAISVNLTLIPSLVGTFNSWDVFANPLIDGQTQISLTNGYTDQFLVRYGGTDYRNNGTMEGSSCWGFGTEGSSNCNVKATATGTYKVGWDHDTKQLTIIYPDDAKATLTKNRYIYFDARVSDWNNGDFVGRFWFKNYLNRQNIASVDCGTSSKLEEWVYYALVPDNDNVGGIQMNRVDPSDQRHVYDAANCKYAFERSDAAQNCLITPETGYADITLSWTTYCPIKESTTISDNGTVTYGGSGTEGEPFLVEKGTAIKLAASSTDYINDANMTTKYNFCKDNVSAQDSESATYQFTANGEAEVTHKVNVNGYNSYNGFSSTEKFSELLFYYTVTCYTVSYNANGGSGDVPVAATKYKAGDDIEVSDKGDLYRPNYIFNGWNTAADGSGTRYAAGSSITDIGSDITLYAQWVSLTTPSVVADSAYYLDEPVAIRLHTVSTGVKEPVVMFYVSDGTETYQVLAAPGSVGEAATEYSTGHSATFYATKAATYTAYAVLYEGKFIDNFEDMASAWSGLGYGTCARVANIEREPANGSNKVMMITRNTAAGSQAYNTAWTTTAENSGIQSGWDFSYSYIHMRYYAPQPETPTVEYYDRDGVHRNTSVSAVSAMEWCNLVFAVDEGIVDHIHPFVSSGVGNSIYIDDIVLSNEEEMTAILTSGSSAVTIKRPFVIYRTGDKADDSRKADDDVESYDGGTIDKLIEYRMKVRACDQWYTLCLPFDVQTVQVWDAEDGKYYDIMPYFRMNDNAEATIYTGHYFIRKPNCDNGADFPMSQFGEWKDPISASIPTGYRPTKNTPYIIQWHDPYFLNSYISFFGRAGQTIPSSMTQGASPSVDNVVRVYGNDAMKEGSVPGAYMLDAGYGNGAWLRGDDPAAESVVLPFECYIRASSTATGKYMVIRRGMTIEDTATGWDDVLNSEYKSCIKVYTLAGFPVAQYDNCSFAEAAQRLRTCHHAGLYILRAGNESVKVMVGGK